MKHTQIFPTTVPKDENELRERAKATRAFSKNFHIDADDGIFTPLICWPYHRRGEFQDFDLSAVQGLNVEVHLMVNDPREIGQRFARAGAHAVFGHVETFSSVVDARNTLDSWKAEGAREVGMAILLDTPLSVLEPMVPLCNFICFMSSAKIGAQGAQFEPRVMKRIAQTHKAHPELEIEVDIGVSESTIEGLARAGVTRFAAGSAIAKAPDPKAAYEKLLALAGSAASAVDRKTV